MREGRVYEMISVRLGMRCIKDSMESLRPRVEVMVVSNEALSLSENSVILL